MLYLFTKQELNVSKHSIVYIEHMQKWTFCDAITIESCDRIHRWYHAYFDSIF